MIKIFCNYGCLDLLDFYGLKIGDLKKIICWEKLIKNYEFVVELIELNNSDLIYFGLLVINFDKIIME